MNIPKDYPVKPLRSKAAVFRAVRTATCGTCGRIWDDGICTSMTPTPSGRCPFEAFHVETPEAEQIANVRRGYIKTLRDAMKSIKKHASGKCGHVLPDECNDLILAIAENALAEVIS